MKDATKPRIGFLGTGIMGALMARRLAQAGFPVTAWNRDRAKAEALAPFGVAVAASAGEALAQADAAFVMLSTGPVSDEVLLGGEAGTAAADSLGRGATLVMSASVPVETCQRQAARLADRGIDYVDAPVSGGEVGARDGTLAIMAGGDEAVISRLAPVFAVLGRLTRIGPVGSGQAAKLANQIVVGATLVAVAEAMHFAARNGADPARVRTAMMGGFADSKILDLHGKRMVERDFVPGSPAEQAVKDLRTAQARAAALGLDMTLLNTVEGMFADMIAHIGGRTDVAGMLAEIERRSQKG
jgi:3-hydroxyisobutyrate dehydrogenase-like beta-hydroxyacid dehydrogenase